MTAVAIARAALAAETSSARVNACWAAIISSRPDPSGRRPANAIAPPSALCATIVVSMARSERPRRRVARDRRPCRGHRGPRSRARRSGPRSFGALPRRASTRELVPEQVAAVQSPSTFRAHVLCHVPTPRARSGTSCGRTRRRGLEGDTVGAGVSLASLTACYFPARRASIRRSRCASREGGSVAYGLAQGDLSVVNVRGVRLAPFSVPDECAAPAVPFSHIAPDRGGNMARARRRRAGRPRVARLRRLLPLKLLQQERDRAIKDRSVRAS
jgi:hypothetical protein